MATGTQNWFNDSKIISDRSAPESLLARSLALEGAAIPAPEAENDGVKLFGNLEIAHSEVHWLSSAMIVERLVDSGVSRLSAERIVAVQRGEVEPGRARRHAHAHRTL
jgi:hypothetical protein